MVINTKEISARIKLGTMLYGLIFVALLVASLIWDWSPKHIFEYVSSSIFVVTMSYILIKKYSYIYYNSDGPKIILRYTSLQPLSAGNFSIEVPKRDFVKAELTYTLWGFRKNLIIYVRTPQGVAKFQPVSLTTLTKAEYSSLLEDLSITK